MRGARSTPLDTRFATVLAHPPCSHSSDRALPRHLHQPAPPPRPHVPEREPAPPREVNPSAPRGVMNSSQTHSSTRWPAFTSLPGAGARWRATITPTRGKPSPSSSQPERKPLDDLTRLHSRHACCRGMSQHAASSEQAPRGDILSLASPGARLPEGVERSQPHHRLVRPGQPEPALGGEQSAKSAVVMACSAEASSSRESPFPLPASVPLP